MELTVGLIVKPQGIRGELKVKPYTDDAEVFRALKSVYIDGIEYRVLNVRTGGGAAYLGLRGVPDRNAAELLRGKEITIPREDAPEPEEGRYYVADVLGSEIVTEEGEVLGVLSDVRQAATDVYTLMRGEKEILFPAATGVVIDVLVAEKKIVVNKKRFHEVAVLCKLPSLLFFPKCLRLFPKALSDGRGRRDSLKSKPSISATIPKIST